MYFRCMMVRFLFCSRVESRPQAAFMSTPCGSDCGYYALCAEASLKAIVSSTPDWRTLNPGQDGSDYVNPAFIPLRMGQSPYMTGSVVYSPKRMYSNDTLLCLLKSKFL